MIAWEADTALLVLKFVCFQRSVDFNNNQQQQQQPNQSIIQKSCSKNALKPYALYLLH